MFPYTTLFRSLLAEARVDASPAIRAAASSATLAVSVLSSLACTQALRLLLLSCRQMYSCLPASAAGSSTMALTVGQAPLGELMSCTGLTRSALLLTLVVRVVSAPVARVTSPARLLVSVDSAAVARVASEAIEIGRASCRESVE